jgi:hypothetical protein
MPATAKLEHLDDWDLALRLWSSQDKIQRHARRISRCLDLDPVRAERVEEAARHDDPNEVLAAVRDFLDEMEMD